MSEEVSRDKGALEADHPAVGNYKCALCLQLFQAGERTALVNLSPENEEEAKKAAAGIEHRVKGDLAHATCAKLPRHVATLTIKDVTATDVKLLLHFEPHIETQEEARKSNAARLVSIAFTIVNKILAGEVDEEALLQLIQGHAGAGGGPNRSIGGIIIP